MFSLEDLIPVYPDQNDPDIQLKIALKKEFQEKAAKVHESVPKRGDLYLHQEFNLRFMMAYDRILYFHGAGTGKTCTFMALSRHYRKYRSVYKRVYIIEKGPSVIEEMKNQIVYKCSDEFETTAIKNAVSEKARSNSITREISKWITLETYHQFVSPVVKNNMTDDDIINYYSDSIFFLDEVQNLKNGNNNEEKYYNIIHRIFHLVKRSKIVLSTATPSVNDVNEIPNVINLILDSDNQMPLNWDYTKVTLKQMEPFLRGKVSFLRSLDTGIKIKNMGEKINKIYEIKVPDEKWNPPPYRPGDPQPKPPMVTIQIKSELIVYPSYITGKPQRKAYIDAMKTTKSDSNKSNKTVFWVKPREAASGAFPDGSYGGIFERLHKQSNKIEGVELIKSGKEWKSKGLSRYISSPSPDVYHVSPELMKYLKSPEGIQELACKAAEITRIEVAESGCSWIYSEFINAGGVFFLGQCLKANGFEHYNESQSAFEYILEDGVLVKKIRKDLKKAKRFIMLTHDSSKSKIELSKELFNSNENVFGEYIQCFISSSTGKEGINLSHIVRGHTYVSPWTHSGSYQSESRYIRSTSHVYLIQVKKKELIDKSELLLERITKGEKELIPKYTKLLDKIKNFKITVKVYKHIAVFRNGDTPNDVLPKFEEDIGYFKPNEYSIDLKVYQMAEEKELYIRRFVRFLKQTAVDGIINYQRNVRENDVDYSIDCDYQVCNYNLSNNIPPNILEKKKTDYSTFDILYANEMVDKCIEEITSKIKINGFVSYEEIKGYREKIIVMAIDKILTKNIKVRDRFGFESYLYIQDNIIYSRNEFPDESNQNKDFLSVNNFLITLGKNKLDEVENSSDLTEEILKSIKEIDNYKKRKELFNIYLNKLSIETKSNLLEESILKIKIKKKPSKFDKALVRRFIAYVFEVREPARDIENITELFKKKKKKNIKIKFELNGEDKDGDIIYVNTIHTSKVGASAHGILSNFLKVAGEIRIYKESDGLGWRTVTPYEYPAYQNIIQKRLKGYLDNVTKGANDVYGIYLHDNNFRIHDKTLDKKGSLETAKVCKNWKKSDLVNILVRKEIVNNKADLKDDLLNYLVYMKDTRMDYSEMSELSVDELYERLEDYRSEIIKFLIGQNYTNVSKNLEKLSTIELIEILRWYRNDLTIDDICVLIEKDLNEKDLVIYT